MLEEMMNSAIDKKVAKDYPHVQLPANMTAKIITAVQITDSVIYKYNLKIIDKNGNEDDQFPMIPDVLSKLVFTPGTIVAVALLYGTLNPFILGEVL